MRKRCILLLLLLCLIPQIVLASHIQVDFLDVGQGDAILIRSSEGSTVLIDAGTESAGRRVVVPYLHEEDIDELDIVVMTHPHADHIGGLIPVLNQVSVGQIYADGQVHTTKLYEQLLLLIEEKAVPFRLARAGDEITVPGIDRLLVLHPQEQFLSGLNNNSVVLWLEFDGVTFLFTGDIEKQAEALLLNNDLCREANIIKVAHHGSNSSSTLSFVAEVNPDIAIIMAGEDNHYGHPHHEVLLRYQAAGAVVYQTDIHGTISVVIEAGNVAINTYKSSVEIDQRLNLNTVSVGDLQMIPGIGPVLAGRIVDYRSEVGFNKVTDLINVPGIGEKTLANIKDYVYLTDSQSMEGD